MWDFAGAAVLNFPGEVALVVVITTSVDDDDHVEFHGEEWRPRWPHHFHHHGLDLGG